MSWEDDWAAHGVSPARSTCAVASRSIATADLKDSLMRLTDAARRRVCITLPTGGSPRTDERVLTALGLQNQLGRDYLYAFAILAEEGLQARGVLHTRARAPTRSTRSRRPTRPDQHGGRHRGTLVPAAERDAALARLRPWLADNLVENPRAGQPGRKGEPEEAPRPARAPQSHLGVHRLEQVSPTPFAMRPSAVGAPSSCAERPSA